MFDVGLLYATCSVSLFHVLQLGLEDEEYLELAEEIDLIFHCAASVDYTVPSSRRTWERSITWSAKIP